ncbi:methyltransferase domain-containing protein [Pseudoalteromonas sp. C2R02]|uniref:methyltransferase domain-containing protein n=1 Tax=Pseudoalteromonas sp. C2R02 TaxID=2841565 RepID=UPI001C092591|nr:methyltransferase domain-containing protein [Pseudoalteromonas sp. C2R02]MBU2968519.1 methyltransferase domain-containing protein [Pseudoalteromonas sp. C2R02]
MSPVNPQQQNKCATQRKFSQAAVNYHEHACVQSQSAKILLADIPDNNLGLCLDLGAGPGVNTKVLSQKYEQVISLDLSISMLEEINTLSTKPAYKICADMDYLPFKAKSFDSVFSNFATQWSQNLPLLLKNINRVLKPGAKFYLTIVCDGTLKEIAHAWQEVDQQKHINDFVKPTDLLKYIKQANFKLQSYRLNCHKDNYKDPLSAIKSIKEIGASNMVQAKVNKGLMGKNRLKTLLNAYPKSNNGFDVSYQVAYLTLEK